MTATSFLSDFSDIKKEYINYLQVTKKSSPNTLSAYIRDIDKFFDFAHRFGINTFDDVDKGVVEEYKYNLKRSGFSSASVSRALSVLRSLMQHLVTIGALDHNAAKEIHNDKARKHMPSILSGKEVELLLSQPSGDDAKSVRDRAMMELLYATGLKVSELVALNVSDVNFQLSIIRCVKGEKERILPIYPLAAKALNEYVNTARRALVFRRDEDALFVNVSGERMTRQGLWKLIKTYAYDAKISVDITPHTLRHSFAAHLLENGADIHDIQEILGHADISSTQRYAQFLKEHHRKNYMKFHPRA